MSRWKYAAALLMLMSMGMAMVIPGGVVVEGRLTRTPLPGTSTPLTITVTKGGLDYFGRILISIPDDCRLSAKQLQGGGMSVDENRQVVVISWLKLPASNRFDVVLDLVVSTVTVSMGMLMLPPTMVSFPLKLILFVMVDGWNLVVGMLLQSFGPFS